jgi:hypothetical protein
VLTVTGDRRKGVSQRTFELGGQVVSFLDVQGQEEKFSGLTSPKTDEDRTTVSEVLRKTAGFVSDLRETFRMQFKGFEEGMLKGLSSSHTLNLRQPRVFTFADSLVAAVRIQKDNGDIPLMVGVYSILATAAMLMLIALESENALRGGIDAGFATDVGSDEVYGTAVSRAYILESKRALHPRILIGENFLGWLSMEAATLNRNANSSNAATREIVNRIFELVKADADGRTILHYLGPAIERVKSDALRAQIQKAYDFVVTEQHRFTDAGRMKLSERYFLVRSYFESNASAWDLKMRPD